MIAHFAQWWDGTKLFIQMGLRIGRDGPHAHVGILIMVAALLVTRGRWPRLAWAAALIAELVNEGLDLSWAGPESSFSASSHDLVVTMIPPTILLIGISALQRRIRPETP